MGEATIDVTGGAGQARMVRAGEVSARELTEQALERIERLDPSTREVARACALRHTWSDVARTMVHTMFDDPAVRA